MQNFGCETFKKLVGGVSSQEVDGLREVPSIIAVNSDTKTIFAQCVTINFDVSPLDRTEPRLCPIF